MISLRARAAMTFFSMSKQALLLHPNNTQLMRRLFESQKHIAPLPSGLRSERIDGAGVPISVLHNLRQDAIPERILLYLHGGGFVVGSPASYHAFTARLMQRCHAAKAWLPDYRLAPEHPFPAALDDVLTVWVELHAQNPGAEILLAGDSAGGNLAAALCIAARDRGLPLPHRVYLQSPWLDLTLTSASHSRQARRDPFLGTRFLERDFARHYAGHTPRNHPLLSPLHADLHGLPPFLVQVASREVLLDDSREFVRRAKAARIDATLDVGRGLWHAWPQIPFIPESRQARLRAAHWLATGLHRPYSS